MPLLFIVVRSAGYRARDEGSEYDSPSAALAAGVASAASMAAEEIGSGACSVAIEVSVEDADGTRLLNSVVSANVSPLLIGESAWL